MEKAILLSIAPKQCSDTLNGYASILIRKNCPKIETPFMCYIYCTKPKNYISNISLYTDELYRLPSGEIKYGSSIELSVFPDQWNRDNFLNGKVVGEFLCNRIHKFMVFENGSVQDWHFGDLDKSCLSYDEVAKYIGRGKYGYSWSISHLVIYDKPKELSEFKGRKLVWRGNNHIHAYERLTRPPQSWCYVVEL